MILHENYEESHIRDLQYAYIVKADRLHNDIL